MPKRQIGTAYKKAALKYPPDRFSTKPEEERQAAEEKFKVRARSLSACSRYRRFVLTSRLLTRKIVAIDILRSVPKVLSDAVEVLKDPYQKGLYDEGHDLECVLSLFLFFVPTRLRHSTATDMTQLALSKLASQ